MAWGMALGVRLALWAVVAGLLLLGLWAAGGARRAWCWAAASLWPLALAAAALLGLAARIMPNRRWGAAWLDRLDPGSAGPDDDFWRKAERELTDPSTGSGQAAARLLDHYRKGGIL